MFHLPLSCIMELASWWIQLCHFIFAEPFYLFVIEIFFCWQDKPRSPIKQFEYKHDQLSISCAKIAKVKAADRRGFRISSLEILPASFNQ